MLYAGKGLKPPFKTVIPPQKPVRPKFDTGTYGYFVSLYRGVPVPVSKTILRGKVGIPEKFACIVIMPVSSVPVSNIYCSSISGLDKSGGWVRHLTLIPDCLSRALSSKSIIQEAFVVKDIFHRQILVAAG